MSRVNVCKLCSSIVAESSYTFLHGEMDGERGGDNVNFKPVGGVNFKPVGGVNCKPVGGVNFKPVGGVKQQPVAKSKKGLRNRCSIDSGAHSSDGEYDSLPELQESGADESSDNSDSSDSEELEMALPLQPFAISERIRELRAPIELSHFNSREAVQSRFDAVNSLARCDRGDLADFAAWHARLSHYGSRICDACTQAKQSPLCRPFQKINAMLRTCGDHDNESNYEASDDGSDEETKVYKSFAVKRPFRQRGKFSSIDVSDRRENEKGPSIPPLERGDAAWRKGVLSSAEFYGLSRALITSTAISWEDGIVLPMSESKQAHLADSKEEKSRAKAIEKKIKDADQLDAWEQKQLLKNGGDFIYLADKQLMERENENQGKRRRFFMSDFSASIARSWAENFGQDDDDFAPLDFARLYRLIVEVLEQDQVLELGTLADKLFQTKFKPGMNVITYHTEITKIAKEMVTLEPDAIIPECIMLARLLAMTYNDPLLKEKTLELGKKPGVTRAEIIKEFQAIQARDSKHRLASTVQRQVEEGGRSKAFAATEVPSESGKPQAECYSWRDTGECKFGDDCHFSHSKKASHKRRKKANKVEERPQRLCFTCGSPKHEAKDCPKSKDGANKCKTCGGGHPTAKCDAGLKAGKTPKKRKLGTKKKANLSVSVCPESSSEEELESVALACWVVEVDEQSTQEVAQAFFTKVDRPTKVRTMIDSGSNTPLTYSLPDLTSDVRKTNAMLHVAVVSGTAGGTPVRQKGTMDLSLKGYPCPHKGTLQDAAIAEKITPVRGMCKNGLTTIFTGDEMIVLPTSAFKRPPTKNILVVNKAEPDGLWYIDWDVDAKPSSNVAKSSGDAQKPNCAKGKPAPLSSQSTPLSSQSTPSSSQSTPSSSQSEVSALVKYATVEEYCTAIAMNVRQYCDTAGPLSSLARCYRGDLTDFALWHARLGHYGPRIVQKCKPSIKCPPNFDCDACAQAKIHSGSFPSVQEESRENWSPGERLDSDYKGGFVETAGGRFGRFLYIDRATGYVFFKPVRDQTEQLAELQDVVAESKSLTANDLRLFKCDGAMCYMNNEVTTYLKEIKARRRVSPPYASQGNALPESINRVGDEASTAQMIHAGHVPSNLWAESQGSFFYVRNHAFLVEEEHEGKMRQTSRFNQMVKQFRQVDHDKFHTWGVTIYAYIPKKVRKGTGAQKRKCHVAMFVGYSRDGEMYRILIMASRVIIEVAIQFCIVHEGKFPYLQCPRTTHELSLPPHYMVPEDADDEQQGVAELMDPLVDLDYNAWHPDRLNEDGSREFVGELLKKPTPLGQRPPLIDNEEGRPSRGYVPSERALLNVPDKSLAAKAPRATRPPVHPN